VTLVTVAGVLAAALALVLVVPVAAVALAAGVLDELDGLLLQAAAAIAVTARRAAPTVYRALSRTLRMARSVAADGVPSLWADLPVSGMHQHISLLDGSNQDHLLAAGIGTAAELPTLGGTGDVRAIRGSGPYGVICYSGG
jgi:hypothetical protein